MHDDEDMTLVAMDRRHEVALPASAHNELVRAEGVREDRLRLGVELGDVDPGESVGPGQEDFKVGTRVGVDTGAVDEPDVHGACLSCTSSSLGQYVVGLRGAGFGGCLAPTACRA